MVTNATSEPQGSLFRPHFSSADHYVAACEYHWRHGRDEWPPATRAELVALHRAHPDRARRHLPRPHDLEMMGLPRTFGRPVEPLPESWRERFIVTLAGDDDFRAAVAALLRGAA